MKAEWGIVEEEITRWEGKGDEKEKWNGKGGSSIAKYEGKCHNEAITGYDMSSTNVVNRNFPFHPIGASKS